MKKRIVCENLRSAYNVWNIIRTADGLGWWVILLGYTAPKEHKKVTKTALWAEETVELLRFNELQEFYNRVKDNHICMICAEKSTHSISLSQNIFQEQFTELCKWWSIFSWVAVVLGNEVTWVELATQELSDYVVHIPMLWEKESFNVGQAAAIFMWELWKFLA